MRQILNYKQLAVMWIVGIVVCSHLIINYGISISPPREGYWTSPFGQMGQGLTREEKIKQWASPLESDTEKGQVESESFEFKWIRVDDWNYTFVYPLLIIGGLLVVTFSKSELLKEITQWFRKVERWLKN